MGVVSGEISALLAAAAWSLTSLLIRSQSGRLSAVTLNVLRSATAGLLALLLAAALRPAGLLEGVPPRVLFLLLLSVALAPGIGDTLFFESLRLVGVARAMAISGTNPLFVAAFAALLLGERVTLLMVGGTLLVVAGVYFLATRIRQEKPRDARRGVLLALAAAVLWAGGTAAVAPALRELDIMVANAIRLPATTLVIGLYGWRTHQLTRPAEIRPRAWLAVLAAGGLGACSTLLYLDAVQQAGAARTAALIATAPLFAAPIAMLVFREPISARLLLGTLLTVAGVVLVVVS